ncbi:MAG: hypothetical protein KKB34_08085 [Bacteroidetes bacterium]|nr:hypothetical protein [Bacteroidota bacterium]
MNFAGVDVHKFTSHLTIVYSSCKKIKQLNIINVDYNFVQNFSSILREHITSTMTW